MLRFVVLAGIIFSGAMFLSSCSKSSDSTTTSPEHDYFVNNVLGRDLTVSFAKSGSTDITTDFASYTFHLTDTTVLGGNIQAANIARSTFGIWGVDNTYSNLNINFAGTTVSSLAFMSQLWKINSRTSSMIDLVGVVTTSDTLHLIKK